MTAQELFNKKLPAALVSNATKAREVGATYLFNVTGNGGGTWLVDCVSLTPTCSPKSAFTTAQCSITISNDDLQTILKDSSKATTLYFTGKIKVSGNSMLATKLPKLFALVS